VWPSVRIFWLNPKIELDVPLLRRKVIFEDDEDDEDEDED